MQQTQHIRHTLCIDIAPERQSVLFLQPGVAFPSLPRLVLPSPSAVLARRVIQATAERRDIYLSGPAAGGEGLSAVLAHVRQGCRAAMSERAARGLFGSAEEARAAGIDILDACPDGYLAFPFLDVDTAFWHGFCRMFALPEPALTLAAADPDCGRSGSDSCMAFWRDCFAAHAQGGVPPDAFMLAEAPSSMPRLRELQAATKGLVTDSGIASLLGFLSLPEFSDRSFRQGLVLVHAGQEHLTAFLVWQARVFGMYKHRLQAVPVDRVIHDLSEFRLGWLPDEVVRADGGHGTAFGILPPEAEGFPVTCVNGPKRKLFAGHARVVDFDEPAFTGCLGLALAAERF